MCHGPCKLENHVRTDLITDFLDVPVPTCPANYAAPYTMRQHFNHRHRHPQDTIIIEHEGSLPQCPNCLFFSKIAHRPRHMNSKTCRQGTLRQQWRILQQQSEQQSEQAEINNIQINHINIQKVDMFKYLGRHLSATGNDKIAVQHNLSKAQKRWGRVSVILKREGADKKTMSNFYKAIVQSILLYGSDTWELPQDAYNPLNTFHHKAAWHIAHKENTWHQYLALPQYGLSARGN
jgi:hypothetical protein